MEQNEIMESAELDLSNVKLEGKQYSEESMARWEKVWDKILSDDPQSTETSAELPANANIALPDINQTTVKKIS